MCWKYYFRLLLIRIKHVFDAIFEQFYTVSSILYFFIPKKCQNLFYFGMHVIVCMQQMYNTVLIQWYHIITTNSIAHVTIFSVVSYVSVFNV